MSVSFRRVLEAMGDIFERVRDIILARGRVWFEVPAIRARLWEELERAQVLMSTLVAQRSGRAADDFETRVAVMVMVTAALEATTANHTEVLRMLIRLDTNPSADDVEPVESSYT